MKLTLSNREAQELIRKLHNLSESVEIVIGRAKPKAIPSAGPDYSKIKSCGVSAPTIPGMDEIKASQKRVLEDFFVRIEEYKNSGQRVPAIKEIRTFASAMKLREGHFYPLKSSLVIYDNWEVFKARSRELGRFADPVFSGISDYPEKWV